VYISIHDNNCRIASVTNGPHFLTRKCGNCECIATWGHPSSRQFFWAVLAKFVEHMCTDCYFAAFDQHSNIAIRFSEPYFLKESDNFAVRRRLHAVILTFDTWPEDQCHKSSAVGCQHLRSASAAFYKFAEPEPWSAGGPSLSWSRLCGTVFPLFYGDQRCHCTCDNWRPICSTSDVRTNRRNIHHCRALLWRLRDTGVGYKTADLLTYLFYWPWTFVVHGVPRSKISWIIAIQIFKILGLIPTLNFVVGRFQFFINLSGQ